MKVKNAEVLSVMPPQYGLFGLLFAFMNRLQTVGDSFYEEITCKQFFLLACLNLYPDEEPTANELAESMGCTRQNVKQLLDSLCKKEILVLIQDKNDKRKQRIHRTKKCERLAANYTQKEQEFMQLLYTGVSENEILSVFKTITKMENNLKDYGQKSAINF
ncbi:MAG: MarR family winged helix-turn-helix transcriptional regulator [Treponemataceae bacterium]|nr:MarR family winged helix-turn-helix transcriptional regulator [Treponemataceae bacterium]